MATGHTEDNFDWVTAQANCNVVLMFQKLEDGVKADVDRRNSTSFGRTDDAKFEFHSDEEGFEVVRVGRGRSAVVSFFREGPRITISGEGVDVMLVAVVGINAHGDCRYFIGEAEYLGWEVRKQALDLLFFDEPED